MPPPLFLLCIPGLGFFFFIQMLLCHAYHFHITLARNKRYNISNAMDQRALDKDEPRAEDVHFQRVHSLEDENSESFDEGCDNDEVPRDYPMYDRKEEPSIETITKADIMAHRRKSVFAESYDPSKDTDDNFKIVHPKSPTEKEWLVDNLGKITLFQHLAKDQTTTVVDAMYKFPVKKGDCIMKQGDKGSTFYVVQNGMFEVYILDKNGEERLMHTYTNQGSFGELALLYNQPRAATIFARTDGLLWAVDGQTFRRIVHKITHQKRLMYENLINNVPMLKSLEEYERANLVDALVPISYEHNQQIIKQGQSADGMYFIISGGVRLVVKTNTDKEILLKELSNGEYFGELALVTNKPRAASAYSVGETHLAFLDREAFERLLGPCMNVIKRNIRHYGEELTDVLQEAVED